MGTLSNGIRWHCCSAGGSTRSDGSLQNHHLDRLTFELTHFVPLACIVVLTLVLYIWGQREKQNRDVLVDLAGSRGAES